MSSIRKSFVLSFIEKYVVLLVQVATSLIIARLLSPSEIGVFSVGAALIGLAHTLRDFGVANYVIQEPNLTKEKIKAAFGLTLASAWTIAAMLYLFRDLAADFYDDPRLREVILVLSCNFVTIPFSSIIMALLRRNMKFGRICTINTLSTLVQSGVSIFLAVKGVGFMSLAWGGLAGVGTTVLTANILRTGQSYIGFSWRHFNQVFSFSGKSTAASFAAEVGETAPDLIIGRVLGFHDVGIFGRANGLVLLVDKMISQAIRPLVLPYLAQERRTSNRVDKAYFRISRLHLAIAWPFLAFLGLSAHPIINVLYGSAWIAAAPIAETLTVAMACRSLNYITVATLLAVGSPGNLMLLQMVYQSIKVICLLAGAIGGLLNVALLLILGELIGAILFAWAVKRTLGPEIRIKSFFAVGFEGLFLTALSTGPLALAMDDLKENIAVDWQYLITAGSIVAVSWLMTIYLCKHPVTTEINLFISKLRGIALPGFPK